MKNISHTKRTALFAIGDARQGATSLVGDVLGGRLMAAEIRNFLTKEFCQEVVTLLETFSIDENYLGGDASKIGVSAHNKQNDQPGYFAEVAAHPMLKEPLMKHLAQVLLDVLGSTGEDRHVEVAQNEMGELYSPLIVREFHSILHLHNDLSSREQKGWSPIENVVRQWAFVLKLSNCVGGETYFYPKRWEVADEIYFNLTDNYSYDMAVVTEVPELRIDGPTGTLIIFDCTNYHRVSKVTAGRRYTAGGFIGELPDGRLIIWS